MNIPRYVQLDFLFVVLGIGIIGFPIYLLFIKGVAEDLTRITVLVIFIGIGLIFFVIGIQEMLRNYSITKKVIDCKAEIEILESKIKLHELRDKFNKIKKN